MMIDNTLSKNENMLDNLCTHQVPVVVAVQDDIEATMRFNGYTDSSKLSFTGKLYGKLFHSLSLKIFNVLLK